MGRPGVVVKKALRYETNEEQKMKLYGWEWDYIPTERSERSLIDEGDKVFTKEGKACDLDQF